MRTERVALGLLVLLGSIWGSAFVAIRAGLLAGAGAFPFAVARFAIATVVMAAVAAARRQPWPSRRAVVPSLLLGGVMMMAGYSAFLYWGEQSTPASLAAILVATVPLLGALVAVPLLPKERIGRLGAAGIAAGFAGVAVIFLPAVLRSGAGAVVGAVAVFAAALVFAIGSVVLRRLDLGPQGLWAIAGQFAVTTGVLSLALMIPGSSDAFAWNATTVGGLLYLSVISSVVGYVIYYWLHDHVGPSEANLVAYVNPLAGLTLGVVLLAETITALEIAGFVLVLVGLALFHRGRRSPAPGASAPAATSPIAREG